MENNKIEVIIKDTSYTSMLISAPPTVEFEEIEIINHDNNKAKVIMDGQHRWLPLRIMGFGVLATIIKENSADGGKMIIKMEDGKIWYFEDCYLGANSDFGKCELEIIFGQARLEM